MSKQHIGTVPNGGRRMPAKLDRHRRRQSSFRPSCHPNKFLRTFHDDLRHKIAEVAKQEFWAQHELARAWAYADSLVDGSGQRPSDLPSVKGVAVEEEFANLCLERRVARNSMPGQKCSWFARRLNEARARAKRAG